MICVEMNKSEKFFWYQCTLGKIFMLIENYIKFSGKFKKIDNVDEITINSLEDIPNFW
jgi:hypothetical protein